jgi:hypothetical protein
MAASRTQSYETFMCAKYIYVGSKSLPEMAARLIHEAANILKMHEEGITLSEVPEDHCVMIGTKDKRLAKKYSMYRVHDEVGTTAKS